MDEWMNGWMDGWMDGWMNEWIVLRPAAIKSRFIRKVV
jgi:hypothetical protein